MSSLVSRYKTNFNALNIPGSYTLSMSRCTNPCTGYRAFHVMSSPLRLRRKTVNSCHVGVQDRSFNGNPHEMSDILIMLLICVENTIAT